VPPGVERLLDPGMHACDAGLMAKPDSETRIPLRLVVGLVLALLILVFIAENNRRTKIRFLLPEVTAPLWTALFAAALLGATAGALIARHFSAPETRLRRKKPPPSDKSPQ
jgi:uncharacterized integral membrane protein